MATLKLEPPPARISKLCRVLGAAVVFMSTSAGAQTARPTLDQQAQCRQQAQGVWESHFANRQQRELISHKSHYNSKLNRCFVLLERLTHVGDDGLADAYTLLDVNENRQYAYFDRLRRASSPNWVQTSCRLEPSLRSKDKRDCSSKDEFDAFVEPYLTE